MNNVCPPAQHLSTNKPCHRRIIFAISLKMEFAVKPQPKALNLVEFVFKIAKACRLRALGLLSSENPDAPEPQTTEDISDDTTTDQAETIAEKVHPQPIVQSQDKSAKHYDLTASKVFDVISTVKSAYVQLQKAHMPYDPEKIKAADELVVSHLESLCKIKRSFKERVNSLSSTSELLSTEIQAQKSQLEELKPLLKFKSSEVLRLQKELTNLELKNINMYDEINTWQLEDIVDATAKAIHNFAKPVINLMKVSGWDLDRAVEAIESSVVYAKRSHKKYAFEAYISRRMFHGARIITATNSCDMDSMLLRFEDPMDALFMDPYSSFGKFCLTKYLLVVQPVMETTFFGNLDHRTFVSCGIHPRTPFYQAFVKMALWVWVLLVTSTQSKPKAEMYVVKRESKFSEAYMEPVEGLGKENISSRVEFMVMPGFRVGKRLIKSRVYLKSIRP